MRFSRYQQLVQLYSTRIARIFRGVDKTTEQEVLVKVANPDRLNDSAALFRHDYELAESSPASYRLKPLELYVSSDQLSSVFQDPGGESLERWAHRSDWPLHQRLNLAMRLVEVLQAIHREGLIHKDLNPRNIMFNATSRDLYLLDFALATRLTHEQAGLTNFGIIDGNPAYCAPEQTGRMNRSMDIRSDYYALGATFYQLFTATPPFLMTSPMELVHAQIAITPDPPSVRTSGVPAILSNVILKLLQKAPEDRYQSLDGLYHDLDRIAGALHDGAYPEPFPLGEADYPVTFHIPRTLYGRKEARQSLMSGFEDASSGHEAITMVAGPSGIGKTALIQDLYEPITARQGYFISGKFDQLQRDRPYTAIVDALQQLFRDILSEADEQLEAWRIALQDTLGSNGGLLTPLIPELESILGPQSQVANLSADEKSRVFNRIMVRITALFCSPQRPLVLYLDDLQWADRASLDLLELFSQELTEHHFYLIGAYRNNEVPETHPLRRLLETLEQHSTRYRHIVLQPLDQNTVAQILAETLMQQPGEMQELARIIVQKTGGVPFFIHRSLQSLYRQGLIVPEHGRNAWQLTSESLDQLPATENQVDWMADQIRQLGERSQRLLQSAACLGNQFDLSWLARLEGTSLNDLMNDLDEPLQAGLVSVTRQSLNPTNTTGSDNNTTSLLRGRFAHDRIQQAAYSMLSVPEQRKRHWHLGQMLLHETEGEQREQRLFEIVHHLNLGRSSNCPRAVRWEIARLNCRAGYKARNSAAHNASFTFYSEGLKLLPSDAWTRDYKLTLELHDGAMQTAFLSRRYEEMERLGDLILANARDLLDTKTVYLVRIEAFNVRNQLDKAIETAMTFLRRLDFRFPSRPTTAHILLSLARTQLVMRRRSVDSLRNMPEMTDPHQLAAMEILYRAASSAYFAAPKLHPLMILKMVRLAARHGHAPAYTSAFAPYGIVLCGVLHDYDRGFEFGRFALELAQDPRAHALRCRTTVLVHTFVWQWQRYAGESIDEFKHAYDEGLETGDHEYAAYAGVLACVNSLFVGRPLDEVAGLFERYDTDVSRLSASTAYTFLRVHAQMVANLRQRYRAPWRLDGFYMSEDSVAEQCGQDRTALSCLRTAQMLMRYRFGRINDAMELLGEVDELAEATRAMLVSADHHFFGGLTRVAAYGQGRRQRGLIRKIKQHRRMLAGWSRAAPINFRHKHELLEAEWHRVHARPLAALKAYENAIRAADDNGFVHDQALAEELASLFCQHQGLDHMATSFRRDAIEHYRQWGSPVLVQGLAQDMAPQGQHTATDSNPDMDLTAFKGALKAIAESQVHSAMMDAVIRAAVTFAGAQSGQLLLLRADQRYCVEASWHVGNSQPSILQSTPLDEARDLCPAVVHYVSRTGSNLVIDDAQKPQSTLPHLHSDPDVVARKVRSVLCVPLLVGAEDKRLVGILYLENNATPGAFTPERLETLEIIGLAATGRLELSRKAVTDGLTHLYNHEYFQNILRTEINLAQRKARPLSLIMADIDHFKQFNDKWGHQTGDAVLHKVASKLRETARGSDIVARCGGEEFAIILPETPLQQAHEAAERIRSTIANSDFTFEDRELKITLSMGVSELTGDITEPGNLIHEADNHLYRAKHEGRNRVSS